MAAFASLDAAQAFINTAVQAGTYIEGHSARQADGTIIARVLMPVTATGGGNWAEVADDGA